MPWWLPWYTPHSERIKLQSCKNLIQHYLGDFLEEQITLDQLSVNIYKGTGKVSDINLDCEALNELGKQQNWPIKIVESHMEDVTVRIPWKNVFQKDSIFKINGLCLTVKPTARTEPVTSIIKWVLSNWSKLSTPRYIFTSNNKEDIIQEPGTGQAAKLFAESINAILKRLKVKLENTKIRIEHIPKDVDRGFAIEFNVKNIDYCDDTTLDSGHIFRISSDLERSKPCVPNGPINKKIKFEGVTLLLEMYDDPDIKKSKMENFNDNIPVNADKPDGQISDRFGELVSDLPANKRDKIDDVFGALMYTSSDSKTPVEKVNRPDPVILATLNEQQGITFKFAANSKSELSKIEIQTVGPFVVILSPAELDSAFEIINSL